MTSRDAQASYYDITLPDGTRTEVWSVLRAVLTAEEALGYAKGCLLTRIMRDGRKDTDRQREAEKIGVEAGMLREAMEAYLATPDPLVAALDAVDSHDPRECAARIGDLEHRLAAQQMSYESQQIDHLDRIAALERERDGWRQTADRAQPDIDALRATLKTERQAAAATAEELERVRKRLESEVLQHTDTLREGTKLRAELADLRERYRPRRQSEEPAPTGQMVLRWDPSGSFWRAWTEEGLVLGSLWTHQPPAPEGE